MSFLLYLFRIRFSHPHGYFAAVAYNHEEFSRFFYLKNSEKKHLICTLYTRLFSMWNKNQNHCFMLYRVCWAHTAPSTIQQKHSDMICFYAPILASNVFFQSFVHSLKFFLDPTHRFHFLFLSLAVRSLIQFIGDIFMKFIVYDVINGKKVLIHSSKMTMHFIDSDRLLASSKFMVMDLSRWYYNWNGLPL